MSMTVDSENRIPTSVGYARVFYRHVLHTIALALVTFAVVGSAAVMVTYQGGRFAPAYAVVSFLAWGMLGAAAVCLLRKPPF